MVSERAAATTPFEAMAVLERANEREDVVHLEVGEPDADPPAAAVEAAVDTLQSGETGYTAARGKPALRRAIADRYEERYGVDVGTDRITVTPGSSPALLLAMLASVDPGEEVVLTDPYYAPYPNFVRQADGVPVTTPLDPERGFAPDTDAFERAVGPDTRALVLNSPANPTGAVLSGDALGVLADLADDAGTHLISDEAYHGIAYGERARSALEFTDDAFVVDSFSKRFAMTGWRLGWLVCPPEHVDVMDRLAGNVILCAPNHVQAAGLAALGAAGEYVPRLRETYRERRDRLVEAVEELGLSLGYVPGGAYYLLIDVRHLGDAFEVASALLEEAGVATTPGRDFGETAAPYLRLSYATGMAEIEEAASRIGAWLDDR